MAFYKDGVISIPNVTGNVVITATAVEFYTNLIPTSINTDGTPFGTNGIMEKTRWTSSGITGSFEKVNSSGLMPVSVGDVVRFKKSGLYNFGGSTSASAMRITAFDNNKSIIDYYQPFGTDKPISIIGTNAVFNTEGELIEFTCNFNGYIAITGVNSKTELSPITEYFGSDSICTINQTIQL